MFANKIANHTLELVPGANHTFEGKYEELVAVITAHFESHNNAYERAQVLGHPLSVCIPRWIDVEGVQNFRDIGGWPIKDGSGYVRERTVFRCAHLGGITAKGIQTLHQLRVSSVFDFRSEAEFKNEKFRMPDIPGITHYPSAMFKSEDFSPENMVKNLSAFLEGPEGFLRAYKNILERAKDQYRKIFLHIIEHPNTASVVHCQAGKDRTGLFFVLLLGLCGVDDDIIVQEYSLTTLGIWEPRKTLAAKAKAFGVSYEKALEVYGAP
ncbi:tyrosine phosphatase family-domain-containing protein [Fennellomyces sp. T-0311]|nr:tyrosine phosphatase family-domain-containing protein [Fennellomyces sp. T-0311]